MNTNITPHEQIQRLANSVKLAAILSLVANIYELYAYLQAPTASQSMIDIVIGFVGTSLIWLFGSQLQSRMKRALLVWIGISVIGCARFIISADPFALNIALIVLVGLWAALTARLLVWSRNKVLT
jgi:hypothetical protein